MEMSVRAPAVAGLFYPGNATELAVTVDDLLTEGRARLPDDIHKPPKALIVPHAGYIYSGSVAGTAYALLDGYAQLSRVLLLGPVHRVPVKGLAHPDCDAFATPLGDVAIDRVGLKGLGDLPQVVAASHVHAMEHALEVQLPFLQRQLETGFTLLPLAVGDASTQEVAEVIERYWGDAHTLIVVSSDLSHYLEYDQACRHDAVTAEDILAMHPKLLPDQACGSIPVNGLLAVAERHAAQINQLDLCNSGDTAGTRDRVVGYGAFSVSEAAL